MLKLVIYEVGKNISICIIIWPCKCDRHAHNVAFEKSDLFFICMLRPISTEIKIDDLEVQAAKVKWITLVIWLQIKISSTYIIIRYLVHQPYILFTSVVGLKDIFGATYGWIDLELKLIFSFFSWILKQFHVLVGFKMIITNISINVFAIMPVIWFHILVSFLLEDILINR